MDHAAGADLPKRRAFIIANPATGHRCFVQLGIAPAHAGHLHGSQLQLFGQHQPRAGQQPVLQALVQFCLIG